jgi:hypothetical protein
MTTAGNIAFVMTLAASLTTNVALLVSPGPLSEEREDRRATTESRLASTQRPVLLPPPAVPAPSAPQIIDCQKRLADLNARRAELKRRVENLATAKQSFDEASPGARNAALEAELRKRVRLEGRNDWLPSGVECRRLVCLVQNEADASTGPVLEREWSRRNLQDAVATRSGTYFRIRDESVPAGVDIVERFVDDFRRSGAIDGCTARFRDEGKLFVQLNLGAEDDPLNELPPGLSLRMPNGALADTPLGMCIIQALRDAFGRASLPPVYTSVVGYPVVFPQ